MFDDSEILLSIIEMIYTINSGYRDIVPELLEKYFNRDKMISYIGRITQHIDEISVNESTSQSKVESHKLQDENDTYDLQKELEAKFDELFGPLDD